MSLKPFQTEIASSTLYAVAEKSVPGSSAQTASSSQLRPNIQVVGNAGDVYGSQVLPGSPPTGMTKLFSSLLNIKSFTFIPNYLYVDPVGSDPTDIILSSVQAVTV